MKRWATDRVVFDQGRLEATGYLKSRGYHFTARLSDAFQTERWEAASGERAYLSAYAHGVYHLRGLDI